MNRIKAVYKKLLLKCLFIEHHMLEKYRLTNYFVNYITYICSYNVKIQTPYLIA